MLTDQQTETFIYTFRDQIAQLILQLKQQASLISQLQTQVNELLNKGG